MRGTIAGFSVFFRNGGPISEVTGAYKVGAGANNNGRRIARNTFLFIYAKVCETESELAIRYVRRKQRNERAK